MLHKNLQSSLSMSPDCVLLKHRTTLKNLIEQYQYHKFDLDRQISALNNKEFFLFASTEIWLV